MERCFSPFVILLFRCDAAQDGERVAADGSQPQPDACKKEVRARAIDYTIDLVAGHRFGAVNISVAEQRYAVAVEGDDAVNDETATCIGKHYIVFAEIGGLHGAQQYRRAAEKEWQHTLSLDGDPYCRAFEQNVAHSGEHRPIVAYARGHFRL